MSLFFIDTSLLIAHLRQKPPTILHRAEILYGKPLASDIVVFELEVGARRANRQFEFRSYFAEIPTYSLTQAILIEAAAVQAQLLTQNKTIELLDLFIAATAIYHDLPLLTLNTRHFSRLDGLTLLDIPER